MQTCMPIRYANSEQHGQISCTLLSPLFPAYLLHWTFKHFYFWLPTIAVAVSSQHDTSFSTQINQISGQINSVVSGAASWSCLWDAWWAYRNWWSCHVTLVSLETIDGQVQEAEYRTGYWAWSIHTAMRYLHSNQGWCSLLWCWLWYEPGHTVLHDISFM